MAISRAVAASATLGLAYLAVCGCSIQRAQDAATAKVSMVGMPKEGVLRCMGPPGNSTVVGSTEVWSYASGNGQTDTVAFANAWGSNGFASGIGSGVSTSRFCKVDIVMQAQQVARVNYSGPTGGLLTKGEQCAFAVENCLHQATTDASPRVPAPHLGTP
jgi:hypothetical protein